MTPEISIGEFRRILRDYEETGNDAQKEYATAMLRSIAEDAQDDRIGNAQKALKELQGLGRKQT